MTIDKVLPLVEIQEHSMRVPIKEVQISLNQLFYNYLINKYSRIDRDLYFGLKEGKGDIYIVGINFDEQELNITNFKWEKMK